MPLNIHLSFYFEIDFFGTGVVADVNVDDDDSVFVDNNTGEWGKFQKDDDVDNGDDDDNEFCLLIKESDLHFPYFFLTFSFFIYVFIRSLFLL